MENPELVVLMPWGRFPGGRVLAFTCLQMAEQAPLTIAIFDEKGPIVNAYAKLDCGGRYTPSKREFDPVGAARRTYGNFRMSTSGLVWDAKGPDVVRALAADSRRTIGDEEVSHLCRQIERKLIIPFDLCDNDVQMNTLLNYGDGPPLADWGVCHTLANMNPIGLLLPAPVTSVDIRVAFLKATEMARIALQGCFMELYLQANSAVLCRKAISEATPTILEPPSGVDWRSVIESVAEPSSVFQTITAVLEQKNNGRWCVSHPKHTHKTWPSEWRGKEGEPLAALTGIPSAVLCTPDGMSVEVSDHETARQLALRTAVPQVLQHD